MKRLQFFLLGFLLLLAAPMGAQVDTQYRIPTDQITWDWVAADDALPPVPVLVAYRIKEAFGARMTYGSTILNTRALYQGADADALLNDLIVDLAKRGLLAKVKRLDRPRETSISILAFQRVKADLIYTTEQQ